MEALLEQDFNSIKEFYNHHIQLWEVNKRIQSREEYLKLVDKIQISNVLDLGCGTGIDIQLIKKTHKFVKGVGVDLSDKAISICKTKNIENWRFVESNMFDFYSEPNFDLVISSMVVMHLESQVDFFNCISSNLLKNGYFLLVANNPELICSDYNLNYESDNNKKYLHFLDGTKYPLTKYFRNRENYIYTAEKFNLKLINHIKIKDYSHSFFNVSLFDTHNFEAFLFKKNV